MIAHEVYVAVTRRGHSGAWGGRRYLAVTVSIVALLVIGLVLVKATVFPSHGGPQRGAHTLKPASFSAVTGYGSRLALDEARERGPDPDRDSR